MLNKTSTFAPFVVEINV